jgi:murein DD-endopeptidase MepM/ murein hydrolase activator NlpD
MRDYSKQEVLDIVEAAAKKHGIPRDDFLRFTAIETGFTYDERAVNPNSGAKGLFQFLPDTARQYGIAGRELDPVANADAGARLFNDNKRDIIASSERSGRPFLSGESQPNGFDLYMAHQQGPYGYRSIQAALDPKFDRFFNDTPTRRNIIANVGNDIDELTGVRKDQLRGMSDRDLAKTFVQYWETKYERIAIPEKGVEPIAPGQPPNRPVAPAPNPVDPIADGVLEKGEKGEAVRKLQEALIKVDVRDAKGNKLNPDGNFDDRTKEAVENYQRSRGLKVDGEAGPETFKALRESKPPVQPNEPTIPGNPSTPTTKSSGWPTPGNYTINVADKPREGGGEFGTPRSSGNPHAGIDINGKVGDPIQSIGPGRVVEAGYKNNIAGNVIFIQHDDGTRSRYLHLDSVQVKIGDRVGADTQIGTMGRTGNTPPKGDTHLHFEMYDQTGLVNPRKYFHFQGEKSNVVGEIQTKLKELGFKAPDGKELVVDKDFGSRTTHAVREFQKANGIEATGVVDQNTLNTLRQAKAQTQGADTSEPTRTKQESAPTTGNNALGKGGNTSSDSETRLAYGDRLPPEVLAMMGERDKNNPYSKMLAEGIAKLDTERNGSSQATPSDKISDLRMRQLYDQTFELTKTLPAGTFKNPEEQQRAAGVIAAELAVAGKFNPQSIALDKNGAGYVFVFEGKDPSKAAMAGERPEPVYLNAAKSQPFETSVQMMADQSQKQSPLIAQTDIARPIQTNPVQLNPEMDKTQDQPKPRIA